ncbi:glycosyltransferase [Rhodoplanes roseus]|uniref:Glycosyl transferase family 1 n=1 Tax=Rhodoplanes roseus TaxID=29409 RepID=A0A327L5T8_9BRAD|nr:glycosyltransferase [Rhodoplanes roseus]RAI45737.1 hypothetical protein CH341_02195 [Rhodoplanes roseus]
MVDSALVIASPWPRCGSANIFAAQCLYLATRGFRTALLLGPHLPIHRAKYRGYWDGILDAMRYDGVDLVARAAVDRRMRRGRSLSYFQWLAAGRDSQLAVMDRYTAAAVPPDTIGDFLDAHPPRVVLVNHCFQMGLARRILHRLARSGRPRPLVLLETHDVQAALYADGRIDNVFTRRPDARARLDQDELRLSAGADAYTHVTEGDMAYFAPRLPGRHHLVHATLTPATERRLLEVRAAEQPRYDFAFVGDTNPGNEASLVWFLSEVAPHLDPSCRIAIAGRIGPRVAEVRPDLFARHRDWFLGQVADVIPVYEQTAVMIIPTRFGTGISIKTIEALAAGHPIVATEAALRGLWGNARPPSIVCAEDGIGFARAMTETLRRRTELQGASRALYRAQFSNDAFFARWDAVLSGGVVPERSARVPDLAAIRC